MEIGERAMDNKYATTEISAGDGSHEGGSVSGSRTPIFATVAALILGAGAGWYWFSQDVGTAVKDTGAASNVSADGSAASKGAGSDAVSFKIGKNLVESGNVGVESAPAGLTLTDTSDPEVQLHQWIATDVAANEEHKVAIEFAKRPDLQGYAQVQVRYTDKDGGSASYIYVLSLINGKALAKTPLAGPDFDMKATDGGWKFEVKTKSAAKPSNVQLIIMPALGSITKGSALIRNISMEKV
jgi:hypothetical protein